MQRLASCLDYWARCTPNNPAISDDTHCWTYAELRQRVQDAAQLLIAQGARPGDRVVLVGENGCTLAALILAAGTIDAWAVLENARRAPMEVDALQTYADPRLTLFVTDNSPAARDHAIRHQAQGHNTAFGTVAATSARDASEPETVQDDAREQVAVLIYTTGSTGVPKGVMLTHANLLHIGTQMRDLRSLTPADKVYGVLPITHVMGLSSGLLGTLIAGAHIRMVPRFTVRDCLNAIERDGYTILQGAPAMFARLTQARPESRAFRHSLRFIAVGGAPLDPTVKADTEALIGLTLHNGYGLTEASGTCWTRMDQPNLDCAVGPPTPAMQVRLEPMLDTDDYTGELWIRGPNVMKGYFRNPDQTRSVLTDDGWFNTQDLARQDTLGRIHIVGRTKDLIIRSGFNVSPLEVETALNSHEAVQYCAVLGNPRDGNEDIIAVIEPVPGKNLDESMLRAWLEPRLSAYKRPTRYVFMSDLPVAANGKVLKHQLQQTLGERHD